MAPYQLTLFSFLDAKGVEQSFTTTNPEIAQAHANPHRLLLLRNTYRVSSPVSPLPTSRAPLLSSPATEIFVPI